MVTGWKQKAPFSAQRIWPQWKCITASKKHGVCPKDMCLRPFKDFRQSVLMGYQFSVHSMLADYVAHLYEVEDVINVRRGNITNMPCYRCQAVKAYFALETSCPNWSILQNIIAVVIHKWWKDCLRKRLQALSTSYKASDRQLFVDVNIFICCNFIHVPVWAFALCFIFVKLFKHRTMSFSKDEMRANTGMDISEQALKPFSQIPKTILFAINSFVTIVGNSWAGYERTWNSHREGMGRLTDRLKEKSIVQMLGPSITTPWI